MFGHVSPVGYGLSFSFFDDTNHDLETRSQKINALFRTDSCHSLPNSDTYPCGFQRESSFVLGCECTFNLGKNTIPFDTHKQNRDIFNKRILQLRRFPSKEPFPASTASLKKDLPSSNELILVGLCSAEEEDEMRHLLTAFSVQSIVEKPDLRIGLNALSLPRASCEEKSGSTNKKLKLDMRFTRLKRSRPFEKLG